MKKADQHYAKLLDYWRPPEFAGTPIGCLATTFTFSPVFFEEECLTRFASIESDPATAGQAYIIEREDKLSSLTCASVLVDQHHYRGNRSLRWDMIPARLGKGVMHAKVSLLYWSNWIRLIVASANLSEEGYRRNQEVFGVLDYHNESSLDVLFLQDFAAFLKKAVEESKFETDHPSLVRWNRFLDDVLKAAKSFPEKNNLPKRSNISIAPILVAPGGKDLFTQLEKQWNTRSGLAADQAEVVSPFYDPPESQNIPAARIWELLKQRGEVKVRFNTPGEKDPNKGGFLLHAPATLERNKPRSRSHAKLQFSVLQDKVKKDNKEAIRPVHMKSILVGNSERKILMIGSSNFTTAGTGVGVTANYEANLTYDLILKYQKQAYKQIDRLKPGTIPVEKDFRFSGERIENNDEANQEDLALLPLFFNSLVFYRDENDGFCLRMTFNPAKPLKEFEVREPYAEKTLYAEADWYQSGKPKMVNLTWPASKKVPDVLFVRWQGQNATISWPVTIQNQQVLPPPEILKDLPLDVLISIISSARPIHLVIRPYLNKLSCSSEEAFQIDLDPHKRVVTHDFLLQRTRRISHALRAFRERLERPVFTEENLYWRLYGPVGVDTLSRAMQRDAHSDQEAAFLLAELALELSRVNPREELRSLEVWKIKEEIHKLIDNLYQTVGNIKKQCLPDLRNYIELAFKTARQ